MSGPIDRRHQAAAKEGARIMKRCRHNKSWLIAGGYIEWCYQCGAIREMQRVDGKMNEVRPHTEWKRPAGSGGKNPYPFLPINRALREGRE